MRIFSRLHDTWMETMGIYIAQSEEPMARMPHSKLSHAPMISMLHTMMILAVCLSTVLLPKLLLPPCLGMQTPISWNAKERGEEDGPDLLWNSKMQEPGGWKASEDDGTCEVKWCDANDGNRMLTIYTTTPHVHTLHHQDPPVTMSEAAKNALEYSLRDDRS
jgi:hypothetical protein